MAAAAETERLYGLKAGDSNNIAVLLKTVR